jgi:hypothetical protein
MPCSRFCFLDRVSAWKNALGPRLPLVTEQECLRDLRVPPATCPGGPEGFETLVFIEFIDIE